MTLALVFALGVVAGSSALVFFLALVYGRDLDDDFEAYDNAIEFDSQPGRLN